jgi:hypothetical protein
MPIFLLLLVLGVVATLKYARMGERIDWRMVDLLWIATSAVTVYLLAVSTLYDIGRDDAQLVQNNYQEHLVRGRDLANENLETFCIGPTHRALAIPAAQLGLFCRYNSDALHAFTSALQAFQDKHTIARESDLPSIPERISNRAGADALMANVRWKRVREEFVFQNADADALLHRTHTLYVPAFFHDARVLWFYLFMLFIALRLGKPVYDIWFAPSRASVAAESGAVGRRDCKSPNEVGAIADPVPGIWEDVQ